MPRHLATQHSDETDVANYLACQDKAIKEKMLVKLRNTGNHIHNTKVLREKRGELIVVYRSRSEQSPHNYVTCSHCLGYYAKTDLWKHVKRCLLAGDGVKKHNRHVAQGKLLLPTSDGVSDSLHSILATLKNDDISRAVKSDDLILKLGERISLKHGHDRSRFSYVRGTIREIGRLLLELRKTKSEGESLSDFIHPGQFKFVIEATKSVAGFNASTNSYKTPSLGLKIGHSMGKVARILKATGLETCDEAMVKRACEFLQLLEMEWESNISHNALQTLTENKRNIISLLPLTGDIQKLSKHLKELITSSSKQLDEQKDNRNIYSQIQSALLTLIIVFNRRRSGEVSRMTLDDYYGTHSASLDSDEFELSPFEKALCKSLKRVEIRGKRSRTVPFLLTELMQQTLTLLLKCRETVNIKPTNTYVFACMTGDGYIRGTDCLRKQSNMCGALRPEALRSTKLRKHIAIISQIVNLKDNELDVLAGFMGHDVRIHREFYRLPTDTVQLAKVSKLLFGLESGELKKHAGKSLDELDVNLDEELESKYG